MEDAKILYFYLWKNEAVPHSRLYLAYEFHRILYRYYTLFQISRHIIFSTQCYDSPRCTQYLLFYLNLLNISIKRNTKLNFIREILILKFTLIKYFLFL